MPPGGWLPWALCSDPHLSPGTRTGLLSACLAARPPAPCGPQVWLVHFHIPAPGSTRAVCCLLKECSGPQAGWVGRRFKAETLPSSLAEPFRVPEPPAQSVLGPRFSEIRISPEPQNRPGAELWGRVTCEAQPWKRARSLSQRRTRVRPRRASLARWPGLLVWGWEVGETAEGRQSWSCSCHCPLLVAPPPVPCPDPSEAPEAPSGQPSRPARAVHARSHLGVTQGSWQDRSPTQHQNERERTGRQVAGGSERSVGRAARGGGRCVKLGLRMA